MWYPCKSRSNNVWNGVAFHDIEFLSVFKYLHVRKITSKLKVRQIFLLFKQYFYLPVRRNTIYCSRRFHFLREEEKDTIALFFLLKKYVWTYFSLLVRNLKIQGLLLHIWKFQGFSITCKWTSFFKIFSKFY